MLNFIRTRWILTSIIGIFVIGVVVLIARRAPAVDTSIVVTRGSISEVVAVTGQLTPVQSVELSFQSSGRVVSVPVAVGAPVVAGQVLAALDTAELNAQLANAQAAADAQVAKLDGLLAGSRPEDIAVSQAQLDKAQQDLHNEEAGIADVVDSAYQKTSDAIRNQLLALFTSTQGDEYPLSYTIAFSCTSLACSQSARVVASARTDAEIALDQWKQEIDTLSITDQSLDSAQVFIQAPRNLLALLNILVTSNNLSVSTSVLAGYRASLDAGTTQVNAALSAINAQRQTIASQKILTSQYVSQLALKKAGASQQDLAAQRATVAAARAQADQIRAQISKGIIRSPIAGVVTRQDAKVGQSAAANAVLVSVMSSQQLEIVANIPEVDIGNVAVGNRVDLTVDALPGGVFMASVSFINPAQTIVDGVVNFQVKMVLSQPDTRLKSGLTANLNIQVQHKEGVLLLPQYAILQNDQGTFVQKITGKTTQQVSVVLGLRSPDGVVEILSGVNEGDRVENIGLKK